MLGRITGLTMFACAVCLSTPATAQQGQVLTAVFINFPVKLEQLRPEVEKVRVVCAIGNPAVLTTPSSWQGNLETMPHDEQLVVLGRVEKTMQVVIPILEGMLLSDPRGKTFDYNCTLVGLAQGTWALFDENASNQAFRVKVTPSGFAGLKGTFVW